MFVLILLTQFSARSVVKVKSFLREGGGGVCLFCLFVSFFLVILHEPVSSLNRDFMTNENEAISCTTLCLYTADKLGTSWCGDLISEVCALD